jgi:excisionase family DNA binding protein
MSTTVEHRSQSEVMTAWRAAAYLGVSRTFFRREIQPEVPYVPMGRTRRYRRADLDEWAAARTVQPTP